MEGVIVKIIYNDSHTMKSLQLKLANGIHFRLGNGFSDKERKNPPAIGQTVTFKYYGFTKYGKPKFASFIHVRNTL